MKAFKASDLSHKRSDVMKAAREGGAIIQECRTNGEVVQEYVLTVNSPVGDLSDGRVNIGGKGPQILRSE